MCALIRWYFTNIGAVINKCGASAPAKNANKTVTTLGDRRRRRRRPRRR